MLDHVNTKPALTLDRGLSLESSDSVRSTSTSLPLQQHNICTLSCIARSHCVHKHMLTMLFCFVSVGCQSSRDYSQSSEADSERLDRARG